MYTELNLYPLRMQAYRSLDFKKPASHLFNSLHPKHSHFEVKQHYPNCSSHDNTRWKNPRNYSVENAISILNVLNKFSSKYIPLVNLR